MIRTKKHLAIAAIALLAVSFTACKDDDDNPDPSCELTTASLAGNYKTTALTVQTGTGTPGDSLKDCLKDDVSTLNANGSYVVADNGTVCEPTSASTSTWSLSAGDSTLTLKGIPYKISKWDCENLEFWTKAGDITYRFAAQKQ